MKRDIITGISDHLKHNEADFETLMKTRDKRTGLLQNCSLSPEDAKMVYYNNKASILELLNQIEAIPALGFHRQLAQVLLEWMKANNNPCFVKKYFPRLGRVGAELIIQEFLKINSSCRPDMLNIFGDLHHARALPLIRSCLASKDIRLFEAAIISIRMLI